MTKWKATLVECKCATHAITSKGFSARSMHKHHALLAHFFLISMALDKIVICVNLLQKKRGNNRKSAYLNTNKQWKFIWKSSICPSSDWDLRALCENCARSPSFHLAARQCSLNSSKNKPNPSDFEFYTLRAQRKSERFFFRRMHVRWLKIHMQQPSCMCM